MKKLLLLALLTATTGIYAQTITGRNTITSTNVIAETADYKVRSEKLIIDNETQLVEYTGNVDFTAEGIKIEGADKIVFDSLSKELIASGNLNMKLSAPISVVDNSKLDKEHKSIRYKLGDDKAYLE